MTECQPVETHQPEPTVAVPVPGSYNQMVHITSTADVLTMYDNVLVNQLGQQPQIENCMTTKQIVCQSCEAVNVEQKDKGSLLHGEIETEVC